MLKLYILKRMEDGPVFTHYWNNEGQNYWDTCSIVTREDGKKIRQEWDWSNDGRSPLDYYLSINFSNYDWKELPSTRLQREVIGSAVVEVTAEEVQSQPVLFFKVEEYTDSGTRVGIPTYYYGTKLTYVSNQDQQRLSYRVECPLDAWATYWSYYHSILKNCPEQFDFMNKMCDRYMFYRYDITDPNDKKIELMLLNHDGTIANIDIPNHTYSNWTWTIDYTIQTYLSKTSKWETPLYYNDSKDGLSLVDWLELNGCTETQWKKWTGEEGQSGDAFISVIDCKEVQSKDTTHRVIQYGINNYTYNPSWTDLTYDDNQMPLLCKDETFNSNGKYRYLIVKFGNNSFWSYRVDDDNSAKKTAINAAITAVKEYPDLVSAINTIATGGGKQCITTKKVVGCVANTSPIEDKIIHLNGESICIIPFPKGMYEELYLYYLNSHDKGIVLGDGSILGMVINDIPPFVLAAALKKQNNNVNDPLKQSIGDKLSLNSDPNDGQNIKLPFSWTSLKLIGNFEWLPTDFIFGFTQQVELVYSDWLNCARHLTTNQYRWSFSNSWEFKDGEKYFFPGRVSSPATGQLNYEPIHDPEVPQDVEQWWYPSDLWYGTPNYIEAEEHDLIKSCQASGAYLLFDSRGKGYPGDPKHKANWTLIGVVNKQYVQEEHRDDVVVPQDTPVIPPVEIIRSNWYHKSGESVLTLYNTNDEQKHYFPCIFHDFSYVPMTIAKRNKEKSTDFFEPFEAMLTNGPIKDFDDVEYEHACNVNIAASHPIFYSPGLWRWVYYIDGVNNIQLTADMIDWEKYISNDWSIYLNIAFSTTTKYMLDISEIRNIKYPMTKSGMELIYEDRTAYPFTCEAFNNWYQENMNTVEMSKNAKEIANKYALKNARISALGDVLGGLFGGFGAGMAKGGPIGALVGGISGAAGGAISGAITYWGAENAINEANEQWENEWSNKLGNYLAQPTQLNASGFSTGSLVYTPWNTKQSDRYELFRRYSSPYLINETIWHHISMDGEEFTSQCKYIDYDNRINFNYIKCNLYDKQYVATNFIKQAMYSIDPLFSQDDMINSYILKCQKDGLRIFKCEYNPEHIEQIIKDNVEWKLQWAIPNQL